METNYLDILNKIKEYDTITLFRHEHPDGDAVGSQFSLKTWILDNFPDKKVYALGSESSTEGEFPHSDVVDDTTVHNSLAIILDSSNEERIDDQRYKNASYIIKIDHHPNLDHFTDLELVIEQAAATCEIIGYFYKEFPEYKVSLEAANYLYKGLLTDTICFKTSNTTSKTLEIASYIASFGINIPALNREMFEVSYDDFKFVSYLRSKVQIIDESLAYVILDKQDYASYHLKPHEVRTHIQEIVNVKEFKIICIFTEQEDNPGIYDGSLRSKTLTINDLARKYHGGGHKQAAGVKGLTKEEVSQLLEELHQLIL